MLYSTSLLALVGAGQHASLSPRRLQLFNSSEAKVICELNFVSSILAVLMNRKRLLVALEQKLHLFDITTMKVLKTIETCEKKGLCALSPLVVGQPQTMGVVRQGDQPVSQSPESEGVSYLAFPGAAESGDVILCNAITGDPVHVLKAHKGTLSMMAFNNDGTLLATASTKGTVIRVFTVPSGELLYTLRRGSYSATIFSISFSMDSSMLCVSSDKTTVHVFKLPNADQLPRKQQGIGALSDLWDSVRDFAHIKLVKSENGVKNVASFTQNGEGVQIICHDGYIYRYLLDKNTGECNLEYCKNWLELEEEQQQQQQQEKQ